MTSSHRRRSPRSLAFFPHPHGFPALCENNRRGAFTISCFKLCSPVRPSPARHAPVFTESLSLHRHDPIPLPQVRSLLPNTYSRLNIPYFLFQSLDRYKLIGPTLLLLSRCSCLLFLARDVASFQVSPRTREIVRRTKQISHQTESDPAQTEVMRARLDIPEPDFVSHSHIFQSELIALHLDLEELRRRENSPRALDRTQQSMMYGGSVHNRRTNETTVNNTMLNHSVLAHSHSHLPVSPFRLGIGDR